MPHFENAHIRDINRGTFVDAKDDAHVQVLTSGSLSSFENLHRHVAESAFHDSCARFPQPKCHPDTRKVVIKTITTTWLEADNNNRDLCGGGSAECCHKKPILWLHAPAGAGKSAIAQSVADECCSAEPATLAAGFFFSRNAEERNTEKCLVATLAYQIARSIPAAKPFIENVVMDDPCIFSRSLEAQFANLIARPLVLAAIEDPSSSWPKLVLLDGLDECHDELKQCAIIEAIYTTLTRFHIPLRFLIVSRPEPHIHNIFRRHDVFSISHYLKLDDSFNPDQDIKTFLDAEFSRIRTYHSSMVSVVDWPSKDDIRHLIYKSSQQFIYAATVIKFVGDPRHNPVKRLNMVLDSPTEARLISPFTNLDNLYRQVLDAVRLENIDAVLTIFSIILHFSVWTPSLANIAGLMAISFQDVRLLLYDLQSIIDFSLVDCDSEVKFFHASFSDFLQSHNRGGPYYIGGRERCVKVVRLFLRVMLEERCNCTNQAGTECHHAYSQKNWSNRLPFTELTPALFSDLQQYFLRVSTDLDPNSYGFSSIYSRLNEIAHLIYIWPGVTASRSSEDLPTNHEPKRLLDFCGLFDKAVRKILDSNSRSCPADVLIVLSVLMLPRWRDRKPTLDRLWGFMVKIYPPENLPAQRIAAILKSESTIISAFAESCHSRFGLPSYLQLKQFFKDPSRSAEYFLGDTNAQLAIWSLTTLLRGPSSLVESHVPPFKLGIEFGEPECIPYDKRCSICIHHLSCASVSSPVLVDFPRPVDPALGAELDEDLNKAIVRFLLVCKQELLSAHAVPH